MLQTLALFCSRLIHERCFIGNDGPVTLSLALEPPGRFEVRLIEAREDVMAKICLKLRVQILLTIDLVRKGVQADSIFPVLVEEEDLDGIDLIVTD